MTGKEAAPGLSLTLTWRHGFGALAPYFEALREGRILGARCPVCGNTVVPPRARCAIDGAVMAVTDLPPAGTLLQVTLGVASGLLDGTAEEAVFGLVQVAGSHNAILARIIAGEGQARPGAAVRLAAPDRPVRHPIQSLVFTVVAKDAGAPPVDRRG